ncbi:MAG: hypothetical protein LBH79_08990 [Nitrososphaerota archaeon]|jgi:hypothetical protein|nr:hypothetical protein [Nitrososphaerota archaeon]
MKNATKISVCLILSILIGILAATPLLVSELNSNIRPWITHIQGPIAPINIDVVYADFTITNPNTPITQTNGPKIDYYVVVNATNPSDYISLLVGINFWADQNIQNNTETGPIFDGEGSRGHGGTAEGAWVDGIWYNLTWHSPSPYFDANGTMTQSPWHYLYQEEYWMEGVEYYKRTVHNDAGTNSYIYLNMNGTWVDVTGRIIIDIPDDGSSYSGSAIIANHQMYFQTDGTDGNDGYLTTRWVNIGNNEFDNRFAPGQSRLLVISGSWEVRLDYVTLTDDGFINPVDVIRSGIIQTFASAMSATDVDCDVGNNAFLDTFANTEILKQLSLIPIGNSYIYNTVLADNQMFQLDQYGTEVFIRPRS